MASNDLRALAQRIVDAWPQMNPDSGQYEEEVNGGDCVEWLGELVEECRAICGEQGGSMVTLKSKLFHDLALGMYYRAAFEEAHEPGDQPVSWERQSLAIKLHWQNEAKQAIALLVVEARATLPFPPRTAAETLIDETPDFSKER